jgi:hypothetical protein
VKAKLAVAAPLTNDRRVDSMANSFTVKAETSPTKQLRKGQRPDYAKNGTFN